MNNTLVPESIQGSNTTAIDLTAAERIRQLQVKSLKIDIENEEDLFKLTLLAEMFGVPKHLLPDDLTDFQFRDLLRRLRQICNLSGTRESIRLIAQALLGEQVEVQTDVFILDHSQPAYYNGRYKYDAGKEFRAFSVSVKVAGVPPEKQPVWEEMFRNLFNTFQPVSIYLQAVEFNNQVLNNKFPYKLPFKLS